MVSNITQKDAARDGLTIAYKNKNTHLNPVLISLQNLSEADVSLIKRLHMTRMEIECDMEDAPSEYILKGLYSLWWNVQHLLQDAWKFERNDNFIRFWDVPRCTCPKMDNEENYPLGYYVTNMSCEVHGVSV